MARDILKTLKDEHDAVRALFEKLNDTTDRAAQKRSTLLESIESSLLPHAKWEELVFYPAFKERADRDGLVTHAEAVSNTMPWNIPLSRKSMIRTSTRPSSLAA